jgi:hypothetical protein
MASRSVIHSVKQSKSAKVIRRLRLYRADDHLPHESYKIILFNPGLALSRRHKVGS